MDDTLDDDDDYDYYDADYYYWYYYYFKNYFNADTGGYNPNDNAPSASPSQVRCCA